MSRQMLIEVLERISVDPGYRRLLRESPEAALAGYDLDLEERRLLAAYPRCWSAAAVGGPGADGQAGTRAR